MQLHYNFVATIVIIAIKFSETEAACTWNFGNPGTECLLQCINSNTASVIQEIENLWIEVIKCFHKIAIKKVPTLYMNGKSDVYTHFMSDHDLIFKD